MTPDPFRAAAERAAEKLRLAFGYSIDEYQSNFTSGKSAEARAKREAADKIAAEFSPLAAEWAKRDKLEADLADARAEAERAREVIDAGEAYIAAYFTAEDAADRYRASAGDVPVGVTEAAYATLSAYAAAFPATAPPLAPRGKRRGRGEQPQPNGDSASFV